MTISVLLAVAYMRLYARAVEREKKALAEVERLQLPNATGRRTPLMQEESIYHILLAGMGADSSVRALEETLPHNNVGNRAVADLRSKPGLATNVKGIHQTLFRAQAERKRSRSRWAPTGSTRR